MNPRLIDLHLAQAQRCMQNASSNQYSDPRKKALHAQLEELLFQIESGNEGDLLHLRSLVRKICLDFLFSSIEYLDDSIFSLFPFEVVHCIESALNEWLPIGGAELYRHYIPATGDGWVFFSPGKQCVRVDPESIWD